MAVENTVNRCIRMVLLVGQSPVVSNAMIEMRFIRILIFDDKIIFFAACMHITRQCVQLHGTPTPTRFRRGFLRDDSSIEILDICL
jgi:hypothetical protein